MNFRLLLDVHKTEVFGGGRDAAAAALAVAAVTLMHGILQIIVPRVPDKRQELASCIGDVNFRLPLDVHTDVFKKPSPYKYLQSLPRLSRIEPRIFFKCAVPNDDPTIGCGD